MFQLSRYPKESKPHILLKEDGWSEEKRKSVSSEGPSLSFFCSTDWLLRITADEKNSQGEEENSRDSDAPRNHDDSKSVSLGGNGCWELLQTERRVSGHHRALTGQESRWTTGARAWKEGVLKKTDTWEKKGVWWPCSAGLSPKHPGLSANTRSCKNPGRILQVSEGTWRRQHLRLDLYLLELWDT